MAVVNKTYVIDANCNNVFEALTEEACIAVWSGAEATMNLATNGTFSLWGGSIHGKNVKVSAHQIVQLWKEENWDEYSEVTFNLKAQGNTTIVELTHKNIPASSKESIDNGWDEYYLLPLKEYVENR